MKSMDMFPLLLEVPLLPDLELEVLGQGRGRELLTGDEVASGGPTGSMGGGVW